MKESGIFYLDEQGERVIISPLELNLFRQMASLGRRLILKKRTVDKILSSPDDPEIKIIMLITQLPVLEWSFLVPERSRAYPLERLQDVIAFGL